MCGILAYSTGTINGEVLEKFRKMIASRGPDYYGTVHLGGITFESSVLSLRSPFTPQPLNDSQSVLCYNGQIYNLPVNYQNDTKFVWDLCRTNQFETLMDQEGEFALVFQTKDTIWFGRDVLGRRSLLYHLDSEGNIIISSVGSDEIGDFIECDGGGVIYAYSTTDKIVTKVPLKKNSFTVSEDVGEPSHDCPKEVLKTLKASVFRRIVRPTNERDVAVMFSGGLDCTIVAALLDDILPEDCEIQLLNVAFESKRTGSLWDTPDRLLARKSINELRVRSKHKDVEKRFSLLEINVPYTSYQERSDEVRKLMAPMETVMDLSIAIAFYFASQPQAGINAPKILFSGLGADELFAGYSRHTSAAMKGPKCLSKELLEDFLRLPHRNLGRDDRVCASWGREVRYPFLDNDVVALTGSLPLTCKTDGNITKIILRDVARLLELGDVVHEKKRAIQFGARSAKIDPGSGRSKGFHALK